MRLIALASAILLLGAGGAVLAQTASQLRAFQQQQQQQQNTNPGSSNTGAAGTSRSTTGGNSNAGRSGAGAAANGSVLSANPLADATSGSPLSPDAVPVNQNLTPAPQIQLIDGQLVEVFGVEMFGGSFASTKPFDRPDYLIQPGDQIVINLYGAVNNGGTQVVDSSGNVFIVGVGPVHVQGVSASALQGVIAGAVSRVFTNAVGVYATMGSGSNIGVFVSGDVYRPGRYLGSSHDSMMFFLSQAGGVDPAKGSFRDITIMRGGAVVGRYDLYDFLVNGRTLAFRFQEGDVVFVGHRGPMVGVTGGALVGKAFEAPPGAKSMTGADLLPLARPEPGTSGAVVHGYRNGAPKVAYFTLEEFARVVLSDGDHVEFASSGLLESVSITIEGRVKGPKVYVLPQGSRLSELMGKVPLDGSNVEPRWVHLRRAEVALEQKRALQQALFNLQKQVLTGSPPTAASAALASSQAALVTQFVQQAQSVEPDGNVAVYSNGQFQDLRLQEGDVVVLPDRTDVVIVTGEVLNPGGLAYANGETIERYISSAGGYAAHANKKKFVIRHRDGSAVVAQRGDRLQPGDEIVVLPTVGSTSLQLFVDLTQILFQIALTTATIVKL
jgi:protein involved in polysaccharide export with SLBB domain